jgi:uncharacterized RDD family membrane protein YckC
MSSNPYAVGTAPTQGGFAPNFRLADLGKRFLGALIDGLVGLVFVGPGYAMMTVGGALSGENNMNALVVIGILLVAVGGLALLGLQIYLLATRSQTIGKYLMKTQIVDVNTGRPADFVHAFLLRMLVNGIISGVPCIGGVYALVDICFIFREDRRCIHDLLASTCVVDIS